MPDEPNDSSRRDFLKGQSALDALRGKLDPSSDAVNGGAPRLPHDGNRQSGYLEQYSKNAMGCEFELLFNLHQYPQSGAAAMEAFQLVDLLEDQMTIYRDHSTISELNREAHQRPIQVEERLFGLLSIAQEIYESTDRAFDITSSPLISAWGFDKRKGIVPPPERIQEALGLVGSSHVELDRKSRTVFFSKQGIGINLGGIGKGHALDRISELFVEKKIGDFVVHGGQSSVLACGSSARTDEVAKSKRSAKLNGGEIDSGSASVEIGNESTAELENTEARVPTGWTVGLSHPTVPGIRLAEIRMQNQALGTSGSGRQGFFHNGERYGHIIDPRSGWPASHFLSTTVISDSAAQSDALATAFFVMPRDEIARFCDERPAVSAILVAENKQQKGRLAIETFNVGSEQFMRLED